MKPFLKLLTPSPLELALVGAAALAILVIGNISPLFSTLAEPWENEALLSSARQHWAELGGSGTVGKFTNFLVWAGIGAVFYIVIWIIINGFIAFGNNITVGTRFTYRDTHSRTHYWLETFGRVLVRAGAVFALILLVMAAIQIWLPASVNLFHSFISDIGNFGTWLGVVWAILGWMALLHIGVVFVRLIFLRPRIFGLRTVF